MSTQSMVEEYVRLALAIDQHRDGYIDAYFGPAEWKEQAAREGKLPLNDLAVRAAALAEAITADAGMDLQRKDFLARHARAMQTTLRLLSGEKMPLVDEAEGVYDIRPEWTDEPDLEAAQSELDELLPSGGTLLERLTQRKEALKISAEKTRELLPIVQDRLRQATRQRFPLPEDEGLEFEYVSGHPWFAYNWYLGGGRSRIELNTDLPMQITRLVKTIAHECYPGHHTELSIKDMRLHRQQARGEHGLMLLNSPSAVISEGIATSALSVILSDEELEQWYAHELMPRAGVDPALAQGEADISRIMDVLGGASGNAAFMLHDQGVDPAELAPYLQKYGLLTPQEAAKRADFISDPLDRAYIFSYSVGQRLLKALFDHKPDVTHWFTRLLTEPVTPSQVRAWIET